MVDVFRRPRVAILSTGDELLPVDAPPSPGKIRESNSYALAALAANSGAEIMRLGIVRDERRAVAERLDQAVSGQADMILSTAGVSVGAYDYVREAIELHGSLDFWRVNMRPGKPLAFGLYRGVPFLGLPGNPVSAYVSFLVFVGPALARLCGDAGIQRATLQVRAGQAIESDGRESYLRARVEMVGGSHVAFLAGHQGSGNLYTLTRANALLIIPSGVKSVPPGEEVTAWLL
jgi:molybdopterin molybdotransferase